MTETTETEAKTRGRRKKSESPFFVYFVDTNGVHDTKVQNEVAAVRIHNQASGADVDISLEKIDENAYDMLAATGLQLLANKTLGKAKDLNAAVAEFVAAVSEGKIFLRKAASTGKRGRQVDGSFWSDVMRVFSNELLRMDTKRVKEEQAKENAAAKKEKREAATIQPKVSAPTEEMIAAFGDKIVAMAPAERKEKLAGWMKNPIFRAAESKVRMERDASKESQKGTSSEDILNAAMF